MPASKGHNALAADMAAWRHYLHARPEVEFDCHGTARFVAEKLRELGVTVIHEGIAESGLVAVIKGSNPGPCIGLRADMDALPIQETTGAPYASTIPGKMHACGHDGHTAMLLGAAADLIENNVFSGEVALIFQPAEERGAGAQAMVQAGIMERFGISQVFALHGMPGLPFGTFHTAAGAFLASDMSFRIRITGKGGHAAMPDNTRDPIPVAISVVQAINTLRPRELPNTDPSVVSVTVLRAGDTDSIIPDHADIQGTLRYFSQETRELVGRRLDQIVAGATIGGDVTASLDLEDGYPVLINTPNEVMTAAQAARAIGAEVNDTALPRSVSEDFAYMLRARPGAYVLLGLGDGPALHAPDFDFDDNALPIGSAFLAEVARRALSEGS